MEIVEILNKSKLNNFDAKMLLKFILNCDDKYLIINSKESVSKEIEDKFFRLEEKVLNGTPLQYVTNNQSFYGNDFYVDENVLIPQPDTEILVDEAIKIIKGIDSKIKVLDLCTGSGAIAISIRKNCDNVEMYASDISEKALEVAKKNADKILENIDIKFIQSDMFENLKDLDFDIIVSNPPYIRTDVISTLDIDVQKEPALALDGGEDGLKFYRIIRENVDKANIILMEIGFDQADEMLKLFQNSICIKDFAGNDRVIIYRK